MGVLCTYALFFIVFMTHHFIVVHTTNAADDIFDRSFRQVLQASPTRAEAIKHFNEIHRYKIRITDIFSFKKELQGCRVCVLDTSKPVDLEGLEKELAQRQADRNFPHPSKEVQPQAGLHWRRSGGKHCVSPTPEQHHVLLYGCSLLALLSDDHGCMAFLDLLHPKSPCSTCQEIPPLTYPSLCLC